MLSKRARLWLGLIAATSLLSLASACGGGNTNTEGPTTEGKPLPVKGNEGTITGKISYTGAAPEPVPPPIPAVTKIMSESRMASRNSSLDSSADLLPRSGSPPFSRRRWSR